MAASVPFTLWLWCASGGKPRGDLLQGVAVLGIDGVLAVLRYRRRQGGAVEQYLLEVGRDLPAHGEGAHAEGRRQDRGDDQRVELGGQAERAWCHRSHPPIRSPPAPRAAPAPGFRASAGAPS